ncbi:MAG TPA: Crp/Fnr family transcriptional regulator [Dehalococcoidales bacterium]
MVIDSNSLSTLSYFSGLSAAELEAIKPSFFEKTFQRGEMIFFEGEPAETLFFLISGIVKLFKTSAQGKEQIISLARPREVLNDISIFDNGPNPMSAQAMSMVTLYGIKKERLEVVLRQYPQVSSQIIQVLAARTRQLISLVEDLSFKHVIGRVAKILLEHTSDGGSHGQRLTQQEMAAMAGTAREVVARSLKAMEERGLIRLERHRIVVSDKNALQEMINQEV